VPELLDEARDLGGGDGCGGGLLFLPITIDPLLSLVASAEFKLFEAGGMEVLSRMHF